MRNPDNPSFIHRPPIAARDICRGCGVEFRPGAAGEKYHSEGCRIEATYARAKISKAKRLARAKGHAA